jgi:hypothetical protein
MTLVQTLFLLDDECHESALLIPTPTNIPVVKPPWLSVPSTLTLMRVFQPSGLDFPLHRRQAERQSVRKITPHVFL